MIIKKYPTSRSSMSIIIDSIVYHSVTACLPGRGIRAALILGQSLRTKVSYQSKYSIYNKSKVFLALQKGGREDLKVLAVNV